MSILSELKKISAADRRMIADAEEMLGPEPEDMGLIKNMFWGRLQTALAFPYPRESDEERAKADLLISVLDDYLENEHPALWIDQNQEIPEWALNRLFEIGVMGMTVPEEYGGLGLSVTSYNRVLQRIGARCGSTAVVVSAHQSIGCKGIMLFGSDEQKKHWLPKVAREYLSAFCLSEPNVGCDAGGQETHCRLSDDGSHYILNGEKKWITSGAYAGLFTVIARQTFVDPESGKERSGITALLCRPETEGVHVFEKNRSKSGIRGTWQARIRFTDVKIPVGNRLHDEGKGLKVALTCLNYGRCTLSAGMLGAAHRSMDQGIKYAMTRHQFGRPLSDFELVQKRIANMAALTYAMDALLYMMTGMLDRDDPDIMVETAATKLFCSEMGWRVVNDALQIMGGEGYMTENEVERAMRDSRINLIVEGANEVMQSFIFAYGGKQLAEQLLMLKNRFLWDGDESAASNLSTLAKAAVSPKLVGLGVRTGAELLLGLKRKLPDSPDVHSSLQGYADRLRRLIRDQSFVFKKTSLEQKEAIVTRQVLQARLSDNFVYLFAMTASLSKLNGQILEGQSGASFENDKASLKHFFEIAILAIEENTRALSHNADKSMVESAKAAMAHNDTLPNERFIIHEKSPTAAGTGRKPDLTDVPQFPGEAEVAAELVETMTPASAPAID